MAEFVEDIDLIHGSQDSIEVEIVSDDEFKMLDEAIQNAMMVEEIKSTDDKDVSHSSTKEFLTPLDKFRGGRGYLSVSDLTAQFWCEQQMEYNFLAPEPKPESEPMQQGKNIHLARELELYDIVEVNIETKEDKWATIFLDCLFKMASLDAQQTVRELPVFGQPFNMGMFVYGIIDELRFNEMGKLELLELKTRAGGNSLPSKAQQKRTFLQAMLYSVMFNDLLSGKLDIATLLNKLQLNGDATLSEDVLEYAKKCNLPCNKFVEIADLVLKRFQGSDVPKISSIVVEYCSQASCEVISRTSMDLDEVWTQSQLATMLPYWKGQRKTIGVEIEEAWKCNRCEYADICEWRIKKDKECRRKSDVNNKF
ncbi:hypothetical protein ACROYT_G009868 [Oculina patagonica]